MIQEEENNKMHDVVNMKSSVCLNNYWMNCSKILSDMHGLQRRNPNDFDDLLNFASTIIRSKF